MITDKQLAEWRAICEQATPGPWLHSNAGDIYARTPKGGRLIVDSVPFEENRQFIVASRVALPALLDEVERLRGALGALLDAIRDDVRVSVEQDNKTAWARWHAALDQGQAALDAGESKP